MIKNDLCARPKTQISTCFSVLIDRQILLSMPKLPAIVIIFNAFITSLARSATFRVFVEDHTGKRSQWECKGTHHVEHKVIPGRMFSGLRNRK
ncbi:hypothetical protein EV421DRAFT_1708372 [Armillaria borealis]|uniref:Uncharacterized protein n=1 Tax=Armillaria borealis TaxID=47425 RepID=A0AA39MTJ6_9AGAR|nr:hypothetical protein EV421DRAFT_1708372 [Armillaria borealis]